MTPRCSRILTFCRPPNVLSLSRVRPYRTRLRDATRRAVRAAEAAGQRTAARRLLRRVGRRYSQVKSAMLGVYKATTFGLRNGPAVFFGRFDPEQDRFLCVFQRLLV